MNCTKHFDLSSSLTASCVATFMICWVWRLYCSGLVCSVLSLTRTVIPQVTYCISVQGNCSVAKLYEIESLHIKVSRFIHRVPQNVLESEVLSYIKWQDLGYLYKRRLAIEVFKVKQGFNHRLLPFFNFTESKRRGVLLEVKRTKTEFGRNSFSHRGTVVWNSPNRATRNLEKQDALKAALNRNKICPVKITFNKGITTILNKDINFLYY